MYHLDAIGVFYLWLQDTSYHQDWDQAIWLALDGGINTTIQVEAFMSFLAAYESHMQSSMTLHGALRSYLLQQDNGDKILTR